MVDLRSTIFNYLQSGIVLSRLRSDAKCPRSENPSRSRIPKLSRKHRTDERATSDMETLGPIGWVESWVWLVGWSMAGRMPSSVLPPLDPGCTARRPALSPVSPAAVSFVCGA